MACNTVALVVLKVSESPPVNVPLLVNGWSKTISKYSVYVADGAAEVSADDRAADTSLLLTTVNVVAPALSPVDSLNSRLAWVVDG